jgi:hypothetical protein
MHLPTRCLTSDSHHGLNVDVLFCGDWEGVSVERNLLLPNAIVDESMRSRGLPGTPPLATITALMVVLGVLSILRTSLQIQVFGGIQY